MACAIALTAASAAEFSGMELVLSRPARVAELYSDTALKFSCEETIAYSGPKAGRLQFDYLYVRDDVGRLRDFRTWKRGTPAKGRTQDIDLHDYRVPVFLESAYSWAFIFRADRQPLYRFELIREDVVGGRTALVIEFVPRYPIQARVNDWAGYAWVDRETTQFLRVEAYTPADWNRKTRRDTNAVRKRKTYNVEQFITEYGFEHHGMRFPSHVEITTTRSTVSPGAIHRIEKQRTVRTVTQDYSTFKFFSVRSSVEIMRFVNGEAPLPIVPPFQPALEP